jgi:glycosyltransferase involved in cell wall biosynthesis
MKIKIVFIHTISNTPYKHEFYNSLCNEFEVHVIHLSSKSSIRDWEKLYSKKYAEYVLNSKDINKRNKIYSIYKILKTVRLIDPQIIVSPGYHRIEFLITPLIFSNKITICDIASTHRDKSRNKVKEKIKSFLITCLFDYLFTYGKASKNYLVEGLNIPEAKVFIRGNYSHLQLVSQNLPSFKEREYTLLYVGRFSEEKNLFFLIDTFSASKNKYPNYFKLKLIGNGFLKEKIKSYIIEKNMQESIMIVDHLSAEKLIIEYKRARILILPSLSETWGQVINEAMHFGLPIIISENCGCVEDLCKTTNSFIFNPTIKEQLVDIFNLLLMDESKQIEMSKHSIEIIKEYSIPKLSEKQINIFNEIIEKHKN